MRSRVLVTVMAILPLMTALAFAVSADEGPPVAPTAVNPRIRPPMGVLRHVDAAMIPSGPDAPAVGKKELVVLVGGYQSCACPDDGTFEALQRRLAADPHVDVVRFGADPRYPYDTFGAIDPNAASLRDEIRDLSPDYDGVHIVTHSMGGVVADRAFGLGLSRDDGVLTYVSLAAPHSGSDAARAITVARALTGGAGAAFREGLLFLQMESDSAAVRDLARAEPVPPPAGVVRLDLREATDVLVTERDARDPGVTSRILTRGVEGHGDILKDPDALDQTMQTILTHRVPPDERSRALLMAANYRSEHFGDAVLMTLVALTCVACLSAVVIRSPMTAPLSDVLSAFLPRVGRKPCP